MKSEQGSINVSLVVAILLALTTILGAVGFGWAYNQMSYYQNETDVIVAEAVEAAKVEQQQSDETHFAEEAKKPFAKFNDSNIYGSVKFEYPKTWSVYNDKTGSDGYSAYFNPGAVPAVTADRIFALRLKVENQEYKKVLASYDSAVKSGDLKATPLTVGKTDSFEGYKGMRIDGKLDKISGVSLAIFEIRDKTLTLRTDSQNYLNDFDKTILATLSFKP
ncbi:MAG: hypothetical protein LBC95_03255 [Candidatus Nomurabacteria bacterium]|jgi:hypothetical protein|nr:hypothetical protein [Candidatus Nomurabacteria bacterium]